MLKIYVRIDVADAVRAGKTAAGELRVSLTDEHLAGWSPEERAVLSGQLCDYVDGYGDAHLWTGARPAGLAEATPETLRACVAAEIAARAARATEREAKIAAALEEHLEMRAAALAAPLDRLLEEGHCWGRRSQRISDWGLSDLGAALRARLLCSARVPAVVQGPGAVCSSETVDVAVPPTTNVERARLAEVEAEVAKRNAAVEAEEAAVEARRVEEEAALTAQEAARRAREKERAAAAEAARLAWVQARGTLSMHARQAAGCLSEDEVWCAIRAEVFAPLAETARFAPLTKQDLWGGREEDCCHPRADLDLEVGENPHLTASQFEALEAIRAAATQIPDARIVARRHGAECGARGCNATASRLGALVSVDWYGRPLSREYALPDPTEAEESADDSDDDTE